MADVVTSGPGGAGNAAPSTAREHAAKIKGEAMTLHRAGDYHGAAREFARAAGMLEGMGGSAPNSMLGTIRLSLAASQLKSGDLQGAEGTCSQLLGTSGLARPFRQKASYRRALARHHQAEAAGVGEVASRFARKAYRDAYVAVKLSQVDGEADAMKGDEKAMGLMREMESDLWAEGRFNDNDREAAKAKADEYLEALARAPPLVPRKNASGGVLNMLGGAIGGSKTPDLQGFPGFGSSMPGLMDMVGAGSGGGGGIADLMSSIMNGSEGLGGAVGSGAESSGIDKKQMLKTAKKMTKVVKKQLRNPSTQQFVCSFLRKVEPETIRSLAETAGVPVGEGIISRVTSYLKEADGKTLESWIDGGEIIAGIFRRLSQLAVFWSRGIAIAGLWVVWVWIRACFAPVLLTQAKA